MSDAVSDLKSILRKDALIRRDAIPAAELIRDNMQRTLMSIAGF